MANERRSNPRRIMFDLYHATDHQHHRHPRSSRHSLRIRVSHVCNKLQNGLAIALQSSGNAIALMSAKYIFSPQTVANVPQTTFGNTRGANLRAALVTGTPGGTRTPNILIQSQAVGQGRTLPNSNLLNINTLRQNTTNIFRQQCQIELQIEL